MTLFSLNTENLRGRGALNDFSLKCAPKFKTQPLRKHVFPQSTGILQRLSYNFLPVINYSVFINLLTI